MFVSYAPAFKPEIPAWRSSENAGLVAFGAPTVRAMYDAYYRQTRHEEPAGRSSGKEADDSAGAAADDESGGEKAGADSAGQ